MAINDDTFEYLMQDVGQSMPNLKQSREVKATAQAHDVQRPKKMRSTICQAAVSPWG